MDDFDARVAVVASRQHSLITRPPGGEARWCIDHLRQAPTGAVGAVDSGAAGVCSSSPDTAFTWEARGPWPTVLAAGHGALASHRTGAALWDLDDVPSGRVEPTVPRPSAPQAVITSGACPRVHRPRSRRARPSSRHPDDGPRFARCSTSALPSLPMPWSTPLTAALEQVLRDTGTDWPDLYELSRSPLTTGPERLRPPSGPFSIERFGDKVITDSWFEKARPPSAARRRCSTVPESQWNDLRRADRSWARSIWPGRSSNGRQPSSRARSPPPSTRRPSSGTIRSSTTIRLHGWDVLEYTFEAFYKPTHRRADCCAQRRESRLDDAVLAPIRLSR